MSDGVSPMSLVSARTALDQVSRDEIVNLMVVEYLDRIAAEAEAASKLVREAELRLSKAMLAYYNEVRGRILGDLQPKVDAILNAIRASGLKVSDATIANMPDMKCDGGAFYCDKRLDRRTPLLSDKLMKTTYPPTEGPWLVEVWFKIELSQGEGHSHHSFSFPYDVPEFPTDIVTLKAELQELRQNVPEMPDKEEVKHLHRRALATLTRKALGAHSIDHELEVPKLLA